MLKDVGASGRVQVEWSSEEQLLREQVKLAFLLTQCFESALPYGGKIIVKQFGDSWTLHCTAENIKIDPSVWEFLVSANVNKEISPAEVHFALVPDAAKSAGRNLRTELKDSAITLTF